jgi:hypothetical protein
MKRLLPLLLLGLSFPSTAFAKEVAVSPFVPKAGLDPLIALNITSLVSSELDFMSEYDFAEQMDEMPAGMSVACLSQTACLRKVGSAAGKDHLVAGSVAPAGDNYDIYMVLYDVKSGTFVRKKSYTVSKSPERMADSMNGMVQELVSGVNPNAAKEADAISDDFDFDDDFDDFDFEEESVNTRINTPAVSDLDLDDFEEAPDDWELEEENRRREEEARRRAEEEERNRVAEERRREEEARKRQEEDRRREAEERRAKEEERARREAEERRRIEDDRRREEEARRAPPAEEEDWDDISFGSVDPDDIEVDIADISFGEVDHSDIVVDDSSDRYDSRDDDYDDYEPRDRYDDVDSLDDPDEAPPRDSSYGRRPSDNSSGNNNRTSSNPRGTDVTIRGSGKNDPKVGLSLRAGYANFQVFQFVTYGAELKIPVSDVVFINVGLEGHSTERAIPEALQETYGGAATKWNTIAPFNFGLAYQATNKSFRPYFGGDLTLTPYTKNFRTAPGVRFRTGFDYMVSDSFGLNLNASAGVWYGKEFDTVQADVDDFGLVPQISAGTVILF